MAPPRCEPLCHFSDRLYFTTFPHPPPPPHTLNATSMSPGNAPQVRPRPRGGSDAATSDEEATYYWFIIDDHLVYLSFFQDWGPLNIAMVYKSCILIHELLEDKDLAPHRLVLYSSGDPRKKANAALLMALYVMIVQRRAPWEAFHPIAELEFMPFRDAGRGPSDFNLSIQDCLWGIWKAMQHGLLDMNEFNVEDYEYYEKVENGDWNWMTPNFIAFASPVDTNWIKRERERERDLSAASTSPAGSSALQRKLPTPYLNCLDYFEKRNIRLVVRLNSQLYDKQTFIERGIDHLELYFDDGTNPTDEIVRTFLEYADSIVEGGGVIAVHCKAGLGRTGTLIGAYLIWKYGFTANEAIAFMRIVRPGSVVGPQQQYIYLKQLEWCKWSAVDEMKKVQTEKAEEAKEKAVIPIATPATPPAEVDEIMDLPARPVTPTRTSLVTAALPPVTPSRHVAAAAAKAGAIAPPGQPRKTPQTKRIAKISDLKLPNSADADGDDENENEALDAVPAIIPGVMRAKGKVNTGKPPPTRGITASEQRPTRTLRSTASAAPPIRPATRIGLNRLPRPPTMAAPLRTESRVTRPRAPPSPTPSRLPTLIPRKRTAATALLNDVASAAVPSKGGKVGSDAWMTSNRGKVVAPGTKDERPGLRNVRRRRSSFSSADVVA